MANTSDGCIAKDLSENQRWRENTSDDDNYNMERWKKRNEIY